MKFKCRLRTILSVWCMTCHWQCVFHPSFVLQNYYLLKNRVFYKQRKTTNTSTTQPYLQAGNRNQDPGEHSWHYEKTAVVLGRNFRCFLWARCTDKLAWEIRTTVWDPARRFKRQENCTEPETMDLKCWDCKKTKDEFPAFFLSWRSTGNKIPCLFHFMDTCHTSPQV